MITALPLIHRDVLPLTLLAVLMCAVACDGSSSTSPTTTPATVAVPAPQVQAAPINPPGASAGQIPDQTPAAAQPIAAVASAAVAPTISPNAFHFSAEGVDTERYRRDLLQMASNYNGGTDGSSGGGAYSGGFTGYFKTNLDRSWHQISGDDTTSVAQSRWIFVNAMAYQATQGSSTGSQYLGAVDLGAKFLLANFKDQTDGGYYFKVRADGSVSDNTKDDFGNCTPILALSAAYSVEKLSWQLDEAIAQTNLFITRFADPLGGAGFAPTYDRAFSTLLGTASRNAECITHVFEGLLALHDVADAARLPAVDAEIVKLGHFITTKVIQPAAGSDLNHRYFAYYFNNDWSPSKVSFNASTMYAGGAWASVGHTFEMAYLLSRAVERGFDATWLNTAQPLVQFAIQYGFNTTYGGVRFLTDYSGNPYPAANDPTNSTYDWWPQAEAARALLHFAVVRGRSDYLVYFKTQEAFIRNNFVDAQSGGWYGRLLGNAGTGTLSPQSTNKGTIWQDGYHETMFYSEVLRLAALYP